MGCVVVTPGHIAMSFAVGTGSVGRRFICLPRPTVSTSKEQGDPKVNCPVCGKTELKNFLVVKDKSVSQESFVIVQCENCGFKFTIS